MVVKIPECEPEDTAAELRAAIARHRLYIYVVAARAKINPILVSRLINGRAPLTPALAQRLRDAILAEATAERAERRV